MHYTDAGRRPPPPADGERRWRYRWFVSFLHPSTKHRTYTWLQAARQCARRGLVLASIENMKKDLVIDDLLDKLISKIGESDTGVLCAGRSGYA